MSLSQRFFFLIVPGVLGCMILGALLSKGCSGIDPEQDRAELMAVAQKYWELKKEGDWMKIYDLIDPPSKKNISLQEYVTRHGGVIIFPNFEILDVHIEGDKGDAEVRYQMKFNHPFFKENESPEYEHTEPYVKIDGKWYVQYVEPSLMRESKNKPLPPPKKIDKKATEILPPNVKKSKLPEIPKGGEEKKE